MVQVQVLRLGHRIHRDIRVTTHCCLVARALRASKITVIGEKDTSIEKTVKEVVKNWGGPFRAEFKENWRKEISKAKNKGFKLVHLTMYGEKIEKKIAELRKQKKLVVVVGAKKVPGEVYQKSDYNIAVTNQPHSEIGALAVFLNELFQGKEKQFSKAKKRVIPQAKGKKVTKTN